MTFRSLRWGQRNFDLEKEGALLEKGGAGVRKNKNSEELMRTQANMVRRQNVAAGGWSRNYNTVRHTSTSTKKIGSISNATIVGLLVLIVGLIYVSQGTQATNYDYQLSEIENEISELEAKKEDLAVERARLTSVAAADNNEVAVNMENASVEGWAE